MDGLTCLSQIMIEAPTPGRDDLLADAKRRGSDARGHRTRRGRFCRQAERNGFARNRPAASHAGREGPRRGQAESAAPCDWPSASVISFAEPASSRRRTRTGRLSPTGKAAQIVTPARSGPDRQLRPADRPRSMSFCHSSRQTFRGRSGGAAHAGELYRAFARRLEPCMQLAGGRGQPSATAASRHDLYRPRRCGYRRRAAATRPRCDAGSGAARLSLASERRAHGDERARAL